MNQVPARRPGRPPTRAGIDSTTARTICYHLAKGATREEACQKAGLPDTTRFRHFAKTEEYATLLAQALRGHILTEMAPMAVRVLESLLKDENLPPKVRLDAAKTILDRAGLDAGSGFDAARPPKPLSQMTPADIAKMLDNAKIIDHEDAEDVPFEEGDSLPLQEEPAHDEGSTEAAGVSEKAGASPVAKCME